jgi:hypothetical protein
VFICDERFKTNYHIKQRRRAVARVRLAIPHQFGIDVICNIVCIQCADRTEGERDGEGKRKRVLDSRYRLFFLVRAALHPLQYSRDVNSSLYMCALAEALDFNSIGSILFLIIRPKKLLFQYVTFFSFSIRLINSNTNISGSNNLKQPYHTNL